MEKRTWGARIEHLRESRSITQIELARIAGVSKRETVAQWEAEQRQIKSNPLCKLADFFGVSTDYLLGRTKDKTTNPTAKAAIEYTGLSESAIETLAAWFANNEWLGAIPIFSQLITCESINKLLGNFELISVAREVAANGDTQQIVKLGDFGKIEYELTGKAAIDYFAKEAVDSFRDMMKEITKAGDEHA